MSFPMTKTDFLAGLQCPKRLWLSIRLPELATPLTLAQKQRRKQGTEIGVYARQSFPDGQLLTGSLPEILEKTQQFVTAGASCLFEAAFIFDDILVRCDILRRSSTGNWDIIEVKSSTKVKDEHIPDLALQKYVLSGLGLTIENTWILAVNPLANNWDDLGQRFHLHNVSTAVERWSENLEETLGYFREILNQCIEPDILVGRHCHQPEICSFKAHCWQGIPQRSVLDIPRLQREKLEQLLKQNIVNLPDIPDDFPLTAAQRQFIAVSLANQPKIDWDYLQAQWQKLQFPLYFLDVEALGDAVPRFPGLRPYEKCVFQFSCHILQEPDQLLHREYLHPHATDPRSPLLKVLIESIGERGSIVVYNQSFEAKILKELGKKFPEHATTLDNMIGRLWDLQLIFKNAYHHPGFQGSTSLKKVLPVLVPHLSYQALTIQSGDEAPLVWEAMLECQDEAQRAKMLADLRAYCQLDTLAMVEIYRHLNHLLESV